MTNILYGTRKKHTSFFWLHFVRWVREEVRIVFGGRRNEGEREVCRKGNNPLMIFFFNVVPRKFVLRDNELLKANIRSSKLEYRFPLFSGLPSHKSRFSWRIEDTTDCFSICGWQARNARRNSRGCETPGANELLVVVFCHGRPLLYCTTRSNGLRQYANIILTKLRGYRTHWRAGHASVSIDFLSRTYE